MPTEVPHQDTIVLLERLGRQFLFNVVLGDEVSLPVDRRYALQFGAGGAGRLVDLATESFQWVTSLMPRELHYGERRGEQQLFVKQKDSLQVRWLADLQKASVQHDWLCQDNHSSETMAVPVEQAHVSKCGYFYFWELRRFETHLCLDHIKGKERSRWCAKALGRLAGTFEKLSLNACHIKARRVSDASEHMLSTYALLFLLCQACKRTPDNARRSVWRVVETFLSYFLRTATYTFPLPFECCSMALVLNGNGASVDLSPVSQAAGGSATKFLARVQSLQHQWSRQLAPAGEAACSRHAQGACTAHAGVILLSARAVLPDASFAEAVHAIAQEVERQMPHALNRKHDILEYPPLLSISGRARRTSLRLRSLQRVELQCKNAALARVGVPRLAAPCNAYRWNEEKMLEYYLTGKKSFHMRTRVTVAVDASRVGLREMLVAAIHSQDTGTSMWLPPQVGALGFGCDISGFMCVAMHVLCHSAWHARGFVHIAQQGARLCQKCYH